MKKIILSIFIITLSVIKIIPQEKVEILNYDKFIEIIKKELPELQLNNSILESFESKVKQANSMYDVNLNAYINGTGKKSYNEMSSNAVDYASGFETGLNLTTILPSGMQILVGGIYDQIYSWGNVKNTSGKTIAEEAFNSVIYDPAIRVKISQPLIYNWFGFIDRYAKKDAVENLNIAKLKKSENDKSLINQYTLKYYQWAAYKIILEKLKQVIDNAEELERLTYRRMQSKLLDNDDFQKTAYNTIKYKLLYNNYLNEFKVISNEFKTVLKKESLIEPEVIELDKKFIELTGANIYKEDFYKTYTGQIIILTKKNMEYQKQIYLNKTLPKLNIYGLMDIKFRNYYNDSELIDDNNSYGDIDFITGLEFSYPLGNFKARGEYENSAILLEKFLLEEKIILDNYEKNMNKIIIQNSQIKENLMLRNDALNSLYLRLNTETIKFNNADIEIKNLLDTKNLILTDEIEVLNLKLNFIKNYLDFINLVK